MGRWKKVWQEREYHMKYARWLYQYTRPYLGKISLIMAFNLLFTVAGLAMAVISKNIIDAAGVGGSFIHLLFLYLVMVLGVQGFGTLSSLISTVLTEKFSFGMRRKIYEQIINAHWMDVKRYHSGDLMTRLTSDATNVSDGIIGTLPSIVQLGVDLVMVFFTLFYYSRLLAVLALLIAPIAAFTAWWMGRKIKVLQIKVQESESAYRSFLQESLENLLVVKAFAREVQSTETLTELRERRFHWVFRKAKLSMFSSAVMSLSFQLGYIMAFTYGAIQISAGIITYGTMSVFLTLVNRVQAPVMQLAQQIPKIISMMASAERIMELYTLPLESSASQQMEAETVGVEISHVTFGYGEELVLEDACLKIDPGEIVAIVGESGIGKTTLVRLLMSFMSNLKGEISYYDGYGYRERANAAARRFTAYVPQGNTLFSGTIRHNIQMGSETASQEEMEEALRLSAAYDFVMELPQGLDTVIGERGHGLSEGQAQRLAIARALVRKAPFLILDEATSSLDETTELEVLQGILKLKPRPTCLIITHRKSILRYCDREIRIENKRIFESPSGQALSENKNQPSPSTP